jgi:hypothetical protein
MREEVTVREDVSVRKKGQELKDREGVAEKGRY